MFKELSVRLALRKLQANLPNARKQGPSRVTAANNVVEAAAKLGRLHDSTTVDALVGALQAEDLDEKVYIAVVDALASISDPRAAEPLSIALTKRRFLLFGLSHELKSGFPKLGCSVVNALQQVAGQQALESLTVALGFQPEVRKAAATALQRVGESTWAALIKGDDGDWQRIAESKHRLAHVPLASALWKPNKPLFAAIGTVRGKEIVESLISAFRNYEDGELRKELAAALGTLGEPQWGTIIKGTDDDWNALGNCGDARAIEPLQAIIRALDERAVLNRAGDAAAQRLKQMAGGNPLLSGLLNDPKQQQRRVREARIRPLVTAALETLKRQTSSQTT